MRKSMLHTATVPIQEMILHYLEPERFEESCRSCENYGINPACPPHDFDVPEFWKHFAYLDLYALSIPAGDSWEDADQQLTERLFSMERTVPGSLCLSSGSGGGLREEGMRYSIQSLGGNVEKLCRELLGISLQWAAEGSAPDRLTVVGGLLRGTGETIL
jgi:predicted metal-binding protein